MKKKEVLIIFILAVLVAGGGWFIKWRSITCGIVKCIGINTLCHGFPLTFAINYQLSPRYTLSEIGSCADLPGQIDWIPSVFVLNFLFWFLVLVIGWWVVKKIILWYKKDKF